MMKHYSGRLASANIRMRMNDIRRFLGSMLLYALCAHNVSGQTVSSNEYKFKAVYIYNFLQFVRWPSETFQDDTSPIVVGVLGNENLATLLTQTVKNESIRDRAITVRSFADASEVKGCNLLFISRTQGKTAQGVLAKLKGHPVLTVGEAEGFTQTGGAINFYFEDNKLRFEINPEVVKSANLEISSKLLRLAKIAETE